MPRIATNLVFVIVAVFSVTASCVSLHADDEPAIGLSDERVLELIDELQQGEEETRRLAARALRDSGTRDERVIMALGRATRDRDTQVYSLSVDALARLGADAAPAINFLIDRLEDSDQQKRYRAAYALGSMGSASVPTLQEIISANAGRYRTEAAVRALSWAGKDAALAIPSLVAALANEKEDVADAACETLWKIGDVSADALLASLTSDNAQVRRLAAQSLGHIEGSHPEWSSSIVPLLTDSDAGVRAAATESFASLARR
ncbi:MAG: HEAT repeat domain-containing protein, partial [Planctomycetales bacterium]|nr:HEAT repeat domain-containing protein [Planctomycetales bacterium]